MKADKIINTTIDNGLIQIPKNTKVPKSELKKYKELSNRVWTMTVQTLYKTKKVPREQVIRRIYHSLYTAQYIYRIGKHEIKDDRKLLELQIAGLMHDMYKYYPCNHAETAASVAHGLGLPKDIVQAIAKHNTKPGNNQSIYLSVLMDADNLSKMTPEFLLDLLRSDKSKSKIESLMQCSTKSGKDILKLKLKEVDLLIKVLDIEKSLNR